EMRRFVYSEVDWSFVILRGLCDCGELGLLRLPFWLAREGGFGVEMWDWSPARGLGLEPGAGLGIGARRGAWDWSPARGLRPDCGSYLVYNFSLIVFANQFYFFGIGLACCLTRLHTNTVEESTQNH